MAPTVTLIANIVPGKIEWKLRVRVIRLWTLPEFKNPGLTNNIEMVLLDQNCGKIHASIKKNLLSKFQEVLQEGSTYLIENLLVAQNDPKFKITSHKFKLNFMGSTKCCKTDAADIPLNSFDFMSFPDIVAATREDRFLDAIGHVVEKDDIKEIEKDGKKSKLIDIVLQDLEGNTVHCTLWEDYAEKMQQHLNDMEGAGPLILILQLCKLKEYYGVMGISNAFFWTKLLVDPDLADIMEYKQRMNGTQVELSQVISQMTGHTTMSLSEDMLHTPRMTIADLIESTDKCFGSVFAKVIDVEYEKGWCYDSCTKCMRKVSCVGDKYYCEKCKKMVTVTPRFKLHFMVIDNTRSTTFILFERVVYSITGKIAKDLLAPNAQAIDGTDWPAELNVFLGKEFFFKIEVTDANIYQNWQSYAVKRMCDDNNIVNQFLEMYKIQVCNQEEEAALLDNLNQLADDTPLTAIEAGDSSTRVYVPDTDVENTPTSKTTGKRPPDVLEDCETIDLGSTQASTSKEPRMACVKIEPTTIVACLN